MDKQTIAIVAALLVGILVGYGLSLVGHERHEDHDMMDDYAVPMGMHRMPDGSLMEHGAMGGGKMDGVDHMMAMLVESERAFIEGMIPHHQEAVDTAKEVIARGATTPEIRALVEGIVVAQEREIAEMKQWYEAWYGTPYVATGAYMPMMRELALLSGEELDRVFLEDMIMHHMGAIMMAQSVQPHIEHDEIAALTQAIVTTQSAEIAQMRSLLRGL
jgi:uncharacterized protein (DUF305 family)